MSAIVTVPYDADESTEIVLFNDAGQWMIISSGAVEAFNQAHLAQYLLVGTAVGTGLAAKVYAHTVPTPAVLPARFNYIAFDVTTGDVIGGGEIAFSAAGVRVLPLEPVTAGHRLSLA
jgi:hypothetical protein